MIMDKDAKAIEEAKIRAKIFIENGWTEHEVEIFIKGFVEGSDWSIESAYHQPGDIPNENEIILCETINGPMIAGPSHKDFKDTVELFAITKWAYANDIMPGRNSEPEKKALHPKFQKGERVCDANDRSQIEPFDCEGTGWKLEAQNLDTMQLDTSKLKPSPMETWKALFASVESFTSVASPQMRAYVARQLYGFSERLMKEMLDTLKETPASEK